MAEADLEGIWRYTYKNWSGSQADIYIHELVATFERLASGKIAGRLSDIREGYQKYLCGSHMVYFLDYPDRLDIIRILHQRQDVNCHLQ